MSIVAEAVMTAELQVRGQSVQRSLIPVWGEGSESLRVIAVGIRRMLDLYETG